MEYEPLEEDKDAIQAVTDSSSTINTRCGSCHGRLIELALTIKKYMLLSEISGSLGDLGTLLPILVSLSIAGQVSLTASLIFGGLWNVLSGLYFKMPICVQPMKAIAAVALTSHMSIGAVMSAGIGVASVIALLGLGQAMTLIQKHTPDSIIKGIQLGTGLSLIIKAADLVNGSSSWGGPGWDWSNNYEWSILAFLFVFMFYVRTSFVPTALVLFVVGVIIAVIKMMTTSSTSSAPSIGFYYPEAVVPSWEEFKTGFLTASLGQIPLTALNSVIALAALANVLFPKIETNISHIAVSVGIMNLVGCFFGSIPYCHGSGGLAAQYRFGARSGVSVIFLGICKMFFGFFWGKSLVHILGYFPTSILGVMLMISGVELGSVARMLNDKETDDERKLCNFLIMIVTAGMLVAFKNDGVGFLGGCVVALLLYVQVRFIKKNTPIDLSEEVELGVRGNNNTLLR